MMLIFILKANNDTNILILSEKKVNVPIIQFPSLKILCGSLFHSFIYYKKVRAKRLFKNFLRPPLKVCQILLFEEFGESAIKSESPLEG